MFSMAMGLLKVLISLLPTINPSWLLVGDWAVEILSFCMRPLGVLGSTEFRMYWFFLCWLYQDVVFNWLSWLSFGEGPIFRGVELAVMPTCPLRALKVIFR